MFLRQVFTIRQGKRQAALAREATEGHAASPPLRSCASIRRRHLQLGTVTIVNDAVEDRVSEGGLAQGSRRPTNLVSFREPCLTPGFGCAFEDSEKLPSLIALMHELALSETVLHYDETTVQVLKSDKAVNSDHYMIVRAAGPRGGASCYTTMRVRAM